MNYLEKIKSIIKKVKQIDKNESENLQSILNNSFTSTELLLAFTYECFELINNNEEIKTVIENDVIELNDFCKSIGIKLKR